MTNDELFAVAGSGCDTVVASVTAAVKDGGKNVPADIKAGSDILACLGIAQTGAGIIDQFTGLWNKADIKGDPMLGILTSNKTYDNYDGPSSAFDGPGNGGGKNVEFINRVQLDDEEQTGS